MPSVAKKFALWQKGGINMSAQLTIKIPVWLDFIFTCPLLTYRLLRYGYAFRRIYLGEGEWTTVEPADYYRLGHFKWCLSGSGRKFYAVRFNKTAPGKTKRILLHREIMNFPEGFVVDHKNCNPLDNRRANLRLATPSQNLHNRLKMKRKTSSRFMGVYFSKPRQRWIARTEYQGKSLWLGTFTDEIEAAKARDKAAKKYHGEFARLNFP